MAKRTTAVKGAHAHGSRQDENAGTRRAAVRTIRAAARAEMAHWDDDTDWEQRISTDIPSNVPLDKIFR